MLMSDQQGQSRQSSPVRNRLSTKVARSPQTHRAVLDEQHVRQTETRSPCRAAPSSSADSSSESDVIAVHRRRKRGFVDVSSSDDDFPPLHRDLSSDDASPPLHRDLSSDDTPPTPKRPARNSRRCGDSRSTTASGRGRQKLQSKGPRIERLARKSTKSKEIFGFLSSAEAEAVVPTAFAMTSNWSAFGSCPRAGLEDVARVVNGGKGEARTRDVDDRDETTREGRDRDETKIRRASAVAKPAEAQIPNRQASDSSGRLRIANPATRGKKAARREHAMGRAPQPLVPLASADPARAQPAAVTITVLEPEEERGGLPGFSRANGGAWGLTGRTGHEGDTAPSTRIRE
ncbi:hypothetical protein XA68_14324 [Ophiocordyceps unilateralis]|uniref:Uncharacterized protein n=1 Tax=Ophiocordyceps unilateralis TaxID=268505 RepID=A0A2A9PAN6_OPHUN|nr:hypothetical protein XA68_14324 [Ophiocordyceps unilateralis]